MSGGAGGYTIIEKTMHSVRYTSPHIVIGLFDYDKAGWNSFNKLKGHFCNISGLENTKIHTNKKAIATILPVPPGKEIFAQYCNLPIEFYFPKAALMAEVGGSGLNLESKLKQTFHGKTVDNLETDEIHFMGIDSGSKVFFSEQVVPTFEKDMFQDFKILFEHLLSICEECT